LDLAVIGNVRRYDQRLTACITDLFRHGVKESVSPGGEHDSRAKPANRYGSRATDTRRRSRDDHHSF
jgi:hypothetical protein